MNTRNTDSFKDCYIMQHDDIERFADTLADGFRRYAIFEYICGGTYDHQKMQLFWAMSLALLPDDAICIADSKEVNSVLVYIPPHSKEAGPLSYVKANGLKMFLKFGIKSIYRLLRFESETQRVAKRHRAPNDGYLMAFATHIEKQGQHYGKPLMEALLNHLDTHKEGCYLETLKAANVELYKRFSFGLKESTDIQMGGLTLYSMRR